LEKRPQTQRGAYREEAGQTRALANSESAGLLDPAEAYAIDERMKHLGGWERYVKELSKLTKEKNLPSGWATREQRSRPAIKAMSK
jgi:hypothetical protein